MVMRQPKVMVRAPCECLFVKSLAMHAQQSEQTQKIQMNLGSEPTWFMGCKGNHWPLVEACNDKPQTIIRLLLVAQSPWLLTQSRMACLSHDWSCSASLFSTNRTCGRRLTHDFTSCVSLPFISTWTNHRCPITASLRLPFQVSPRGKGRKRSLVARNKK